MVHAGGYTTKNEPTYLLDTDAHVSQTLGSAGHKMNFREHSKAVEMCYTYTIGSEIGHESTGLTRSLHTHACEKPGGHEHGWFERSNGKEKPRYMPQVG